MTQQVVIDEIYRLRDRVATLESALREIVGMPTTERNPDGEEQAAHSIKVVAADALAAASQPAEGEGTAFERSLLRADIKAGNADAAEAQLQRIKRLEAGTGQ